MFYYSVIQKLWMLAYTLYSSKWIYDDLNYIFASISSANNWWKVSLVSLNNFAAIFLKSYYY